MDAVRRESVRECESYGIETTADGGASATPSAAASLSSTSTQSDDRMRSCSSCNAACYTRRRDQAIRSRSSVHVAVRWRGSRRTRLRERDRPSTYIHQSDDQVDLGASVGGSMGHVRQWLEIVPARDLSCGLKEVHRNHGPTEAFYVHQRHRIERQMES